MIRTLFLVGIVTCLIPCAAVTWAAGNEPPLRVGTFVVEQGLGGRMFDAAFARQTITRVTDAARRAAEKAEIVTHVGLGQAQVVHVASNRRILGANGKVRVVRYTSCKDPKVRAEPEGTIDPLVKSVSVTSA